MSKPCFYEIRGGCQKGAACPFAHRSSTPCYWQSRGGCTKGAICPYLHTTPPATDDDNTSEGYAPTADIPNGTQATIVTTTEVSPSILQQLQEQKQVPVITTSPLSTTMTAATASHAGIESKTSVLAKLPAINKQHLQDHKPMPDSLVIASASNQQQPQDSKITLGLSAITTTAVSDKKKKQDASFPATIAPKIVSLVSKKPTSASAAANPAATVASASASPPKQTRSQTVAAEPPKQIATVVAPDTSVQTKQPTAALDKVKILTLEEIRAAKRAKQEAEEAAKREKESVMEGTQQSQVQPETQAQTTRRIVRSRQLPPASSTPTTTTTAPRGSVVTLKRRISPTPGAEAGTNAPTTALPMSQPEATLIKVLPTQSNVPQKPTQTNTTTHETPVAATGANKHPPNMKPVGSAVSNGMDTAANGSSTTVRPASKASAAMARKAPAATTGKAPAATTGKAPAATAGKAPVVKRILEPSAGEHSVNKKVKIDASAKGDITASTPSIRPPAATKATILSTPVPKPTAAVSALASVALPNIEPELDDEEMLLDAPEGEYSAKDIEELEKELGLLD